MLLAGSTRSPSIPNGVLAWFEGDIFKLNLKGKLYDQDKTPVEFPEDATLTLRVLNERREIVKEFECSPDENGNIEINIDEETTALFPWGKYKGQMLFDDGERHVTIGVYEIIVGDIDHHKHNKYAVDAAIIGWVSRGVKDVELDENRHLIFNMTDGSKIDIGAANDGGYYLPNVAENGDLSWIPSTPGMEDIPTVNIKGAQGIPGKDGEPGRDGEPISIVRVTTSTEPGGVNETEFSDGSILQVRNGLNGSGGGGTGDDGGYYTPAVSADGVLTWNASKIGMPPVAPANIKGAPGTPGTPGADGNPGKDGEDGTSVYITSIEQSTASGGESVVNFSDGNTMRVINGNDGTPGVPGTPGLKGEPGKDGENGASFVPDISPDGVISWDNDKGLPNPQSVDLVAAVLAALPTWEGGSY